MIAENGFETYAAGSGIINVFSPGHGLTNGTTYLSKNSNYSNKMDGNKWASSKPFDNKTNIMNYQGYNITTETTKLTEL